VQRSVCMPSLQNPSRQNNNNYNRCCGAHKGAGHLSHGGSRHICFSSVSAIKVQKETGSECRPVIMRAGNAVRSVGNLVTTLISVQRDGQRPVRLMTVSAAQVS
jgi:hypothetical protein